MAAKNEEATDSTNREFVLTRIFDAPSELVFQAWTDPKHMARWWGPHGFTNPVCQMDVRPGGAYRIVMRDPQGVDYPMKGVYREVVKPRRIVYTSDLSEHPDEWHDMLRPHRPKGEKRPKFPIVTTVTFDDDAGKTRLTICMLFESTEIRDAFVKLGMSEGWSQSFERLVSLLAQS